MARFYTIACCILFSCTSTTQVAYIGNSYKPTKKVDVFIDAKSIKKPYTVVGKAMTDIYAYAIRNVERLQEKIIEKAMQNGADAILFQELLILNDGSTITLSSGTDSLGRLAVTDRSNYFNSVYSSRREVLFLKYN
jgi:hypothetical protein